MGHVVIFERYVYALQRRVYALQRRVYALANCAITYLIWNTYYKCLSKGYPVEIKFYLSMASQPRTQALRG